MVHGKFENCYVKPQLKNMIKKFVRALYIHCSRKILMSVQILNFRSIRTYMYVNFQNSNFKIRTLHFCIFRIKLLVNFSGVMLAELKLKPEI